MQISRYTELDFDDILLVRQRSPNASRSDVELRKTYNFFHSDRSWSGVPIMAASMDTTGTRDMAWSLNKHNMITCLHKHYDIDHLIKTFNLVGSLDNVWVSIGMRKEDRRKLLSLCEELDKVPNICIDIANGYTEKFVEYCASIRNDFGSDPIIIAGNVCTPEMVQELILHGGADIVKVGIGPGSACTTRLMAGVGYPQLSAIMECSQVAHGLKSAEKCLGLVCADGGCRQPSDINKAFAAGADFVMLGGMLAGTDECEGEWEYYCDPHTIEAMGKTVEYKGRKKALKFYGMSSKIAQDKHNGGMASYKTSEGRVKYIDYKGPVDKVVQNIKGGLVSCCAYVGATCLKDLPKCAKAVRVNRTHFDMTTEK